MKRTCIGIAAMAMLLFAGCLSAPSPADMPKTHEEFIAAGWTEESALIDDTQGISSINQTLVGNTVPLDSLSYDRGWISVGGMPSSGNPKLADSCTFDALYLVHYEKDGNRDAWVRETRTRTYKIDKILFSIKRPQDSTMVLAIPGVQTVSGSGKLTSFEDLRLVVDKGVFLQKLRGEYDQAKAKFDLATASNDLRSTLLAGAVIFGDADFEALMQGELSKIENEKAKVKAASASAESAQYANFSYFGANAATNLAMLNNPQYWKKDTVYKFGFGGTDTDWSINNLGAASLLVPNLLSANLSDVYMNFMITTWETATRFDAMISTPKGVFPMVVETKGMTDWIQQNYPTGFEYCRGYFKVIQNSPSLVLQPITIGGLGKWDIETESSLDYDDIIRQGIGK